MKRSRHHLLSSTETNRPVVRCFYHPDYTFPLPEDHPFPMDKFWRSAAMIREALTTAGSATKNNSSAENDVSAGVSSIEILSVEPAPESALLRVHTADYLERIRTGSLSSTDAVKLGLPAGEALLTRSRLEVAGTLAAMRAALEDGIA